MVWGAANGGVRLRFGELQMSVKIEMGRQVWKGRQRTYLKPPQGRRTGRYWGNPNIVGVWKQQRTWEVSMG